VRLVAKDPERLPTGERLSVISFQCGKKETRNNFQFFSENKN